MNSEGFRETFLRSDREGPKKAKMAGKKEAKQKAGPRGQTEKHREKEAHKDLKGQGEFKKPSMTKRRQVRKVATMVKRLKKNPEDGESQPPAEMGAGLVS